MNEERAIKSPSNTVTMPPPELQRILSDLHSPDATTRACAVRSLCPCRGVEWGVPVFRYVWEMRNDPNPIVRRAVRHDLKENPWWSARHETRPPVGPHPRAVKMTLAVKGVALSDLCDRLRADTGVPLTVEASLADDKVTLLCRRMPLRDIMRQVSRALGYIWLWKERNGAFQHELIRDPHAPSLRVLREQNDGEELPALGAEGWITGRPQGDRTATQAKPLRDRMLRTRVNLCPGPRSPLPSSDVLEALHQATGMPIAADFYTRLFPVEAVTIRDLTLFAALNHLSDVMRLRWRKEGDWLQFRSVTFYHDRLREVPNRLLARWAEARRQHGHLTLDDLAEIAQLSNARLDSRDMAEGAKEYWGLAEWDEACDRRRRSELRCLGRPVPERREASMSL